MPHHLVCVEKFTLPYLTFWDYNVVMAFWDYNAVCRRQLWPKYDAHQHWAKIEPPADAAERAAVRRRLRDRFPVGELVGGAPSRTCPRDRPRLVSRRWTSSTRRAGSLTRRIFSATGCSMRCSRRTRDNIESRTSRGDTRACGDGRIMDTAFYKRHRKPRQQWNVRKSYIHLGPRR